MEGGSGAARWGSLEVLERLGGGPSSEVFRARQGRGGPVVALRLLPPGRRSDAAEVAAFVKQGEQLAAIEHPHLVKVLSAGIHGGRAGRSMELLDGSSMAQLLDEQGPFAPQELLAVGTALCRALGALHAAGVVHGDVRPRNVVRARGMRIVLADPGTEPLPARGAAASVPLAAGAPAFFTAPELLRGDGPSAASDLYALGSVLHVLATGLPPVAGEDLLALRSAHERGARRPVGKLRRDLPPELAAAIDRALAADPGARFTDAAEMERALRGEAVSVPQRPSLERAERDRPIRLSWTWLLLGVVLIAGLVGLWPLRRGEPASPAPGASRESMPIAEPIDPAPAFEARLFRSGRLRDEPLGPSGSVVAGDELYLILAPSEEQFL
ncbi:MAG: serine/threonine protein kinase [Acidobacteria bacterium]|nr:serine/threonine protein kinase [Acidobacteriota bacterium]